MTPNPDCIVDRRNNFIIDVIRDRADLRTCAQAARELYPRPRRGRATAPSTVLRDIICGRLAGVKIKRTWFTTAAAYADMVRRETEQSLPGGAAAEPQRAAEHTPTAASKAARKELAEMGVH